jgi:hypothetical protein
MRERNVVFSGRSTVYRRGCSSVIFYSVLSVPPCSILSCTFLFCSPCCLADLFYLVLSFSFLCFPALHCRVLSCYLALFYSILSCPLTSCCPLHCPILLRNAVYSIWTEMFQPLKSLDHRLVTYERDVGRNVTNKTVSFGQPFRASDPHVLLSVWYEIIRET